MNAHRGGGAFLPIASNPDSYFPPSNRPISSRQAPSSKTPWRPPEPERGAIDTEGQPAPREPTLRSRPSEPEPAEPAEELPAEPSEVAMPKRGKKRSPESIRKFKATLARKRKAREAAEAAGDAPAISPPPKGKRASKRTAKRETGQRHLPLPGADMAALGEALTDLLVTALGPVITQAVSEEIRRRFS